jgi:hypothetical protein
LSAAFRPATKVFSSLNLLGIRSPVEFLRSRVVSVADAFPMARIMLPLPLTALANFLAKIVAIYGAVKIGVSVDVDVDIPAAPVAASPRVSPRSAERDAGPESKHGSKHIPGRIPGIRRVSRIRPRPVDHGRIIGRNVDDLRAGRLDFYDLLLDNNLLLFCRF